MGVSLHSLVRRVPMALGPVIGGLLIGIYGEVQGVRLAFVAALVLAGASLFLQPILAHGEPRVPATARPRGAYGLSLLDASLRRLLVSDILGRFSEQIPYAFVVVWCVSIQKITPLQFGLLTTVEMATAMLIYVPVAAFADRSTKKPFVVTTFGFFTIFPRVLRFAQSVGVMVLAFVIRGLKEFGEPTRKALIMDLAPEDRKAATFGLYYLIRDVVVSVAAFGGALLWDASTARLIADTLGVGRAAVPFFESIASPTTTFLVAFGCGLAGTVYFALFGRDLGPAAPEGPSPPNGRSRPA
jgi:MFS family permease